jgi:hypothetical protein
MKDFLSRVAARATGTAPLLRPASTARHAPTPRDLQPPPLAAHEEVIAERGPAAPEPQGEVRPPISSPGPRSGDEEPLQRPPVHAREQIAPAGAIPEPGEVTPPREPPRARPPDEPAAARVSTASAPPEPIAATVEPTRAPRPTVSAPPGPAPAREPRPESAPAGATVASAPIVARTATASAGPRPPDPAAAARAKRAPAPATSEAGSTPPPRPVSVRVVQPPPAVQPSPSEAFTAAAAQAEAPAGPELVVTDRGRAHDDHGSDALDALAARAEAGLIGSFAPLPFARGGARDGGARAAPVAPAASESPSEVRISIGRLEVHAPPLLAPAPDPEPRARRRPRVALQDYLGRHRGGRRG